MGAKTRVFVLARLRPMLDAFKEAIAEERANGASDARIEAMIDYAVKTNTQHVDPDVLEMMMLELREVAWATHEGPGKVQ